MNFWVIFLTGLTIGGLTCAAVQGGLLASVIAARQSKHGAAPRSAWFWQSSALPTVSFLSAKLIAYILLGFALGAFGERLSLSPATTALMQAAAGLYMLAIAANLLKLHPIFRYAVIQPPRFITRLVRNEARSADFFAPALLGILTIFIPCGTTLAMEALAISTGSPVLGAAVMGLFTLGTMPLFAGLGFVMTALGRFQQRFLKFAAFAVLYLGISSINGALTVMGSPVTFQTTTKPVRNFVAFLADPSRSLTGGQVLAARLSDGQAGAGTVRTIGGVQVADITVSPTSYSPDYIEVKAGRPVRLNLTTSGGPGCTSVFTIPQLGIRKRLPLAGTEAVEFTPTTAGQLTWTCSMGMFSGTIQVKS